jgi:hypothetical protein
MNSQHKLNRLGNRLKRLEKKVKETKGETNGYWKSRIVEIKDILGIKK